MKEAAGHTEQADPLSVIIKMTIVCCVESQTNEIEMKENMAHAFHWNSNSLPLFLYSNQCLDDK